MKALGWIAIIVAGISFVLAVASKALGYPFGFLHGGITADNSLGFTNMCLLTAIAFILLAIANKK